MRINHLDQCALGNVLVAVPVSVFGAIVAKRTGIRRVLQEPTVTTTASEQSVEARKRAIRLLQLGLTSNDDMRLLSEYFRHLDAMVNSMTHVMISYRSRSDRQLARRLYDQLSELEVSRTTAARDGKSCALSLVI